MLKNKKGGRKTKNKRGTFISLLQKEDRDAKISRKKGDVFQIEIAVRPKCIPALKAAFPADSSPNIQLTVGEAISKQNRQRCEFSFPGASQAIFLRQFQWFLNNRDKPVAAVPSTTAALLSLTPNGVLSGGGQKNKVVVTELMGAVILRKVAEKYYARQQEEAAEAEAEIKARINAEIAAALSRLESSRLEPPEGEEETDLTRDIRAVLESLQESYLSGSASQDGAEEESEEDEDDDEASDSEDSWVILETDKAAAVVPPPRSLSPKF